MTRDIGGLLFLILVLLMMMANHIGVPGIRWLWLSMMAFVIGKYVFGLTF